MLPHVIAFLLAQGAPVESVPSSVPVLQPEEAARFAAEGRRTMARINGEVTGWSDEQFSSALTAAFSGRTKLIYQEGHGVFAEYTAPDGQLRMWYPNNQAVVKGRWGVQRVSDAVRICFHYFNSTNPVTREFEPRECIPAAQALSEVPVLRSWPGDVFNLMSDRIPYRKGLMDMPAPQ